MIDKKKVLYFATSTYSHMPNCCDWPFYITIFRSSLIDNHFECFVCLHTITGANILHGCLRRFCDACIEESI